MNVWVFKCFYVKALLYGNYNGMDKYPLQVQYCESAVLNAPGSEMRDKKADVSLNNIPIYPAAKNITQSQSVNNKVNTSYSINYIPIQFSICASVFITQSIYANSQSYM